MHDAMYKNLGMKVEIWSDVMCPFCYIGKRKLEMALSQFHGKDQIEIEWHSFLLNPDIQYQPGKDVYTYLSELKGQSLEWSVMMHDQLAASALELGLVYNFDKAVIANSFNAHRLIQLAKKNHLGDEAEERLFKAYFTEGKNISYDTTLLELGIEIGLKKEEIIEVLASDAYSKEVYKDIEEARKFGVRGVPFFVMNRTHAVSGAQSIDVFTQTLEQSFAGWRKDNPAFVMEAQTGGTCTPDGDCN